MVLRQEKVLVRSVQKVMSHSEFVNRIRKSLYLFGSEELEISSPLAEYASELFSEPHKNHSLNRLNKVTAGSCHVANPCTLIMALIYLDRLNATDLNYVRSITPSELFIVAMMISTKFYAGFDEDFCLNDWTIDNEISEEQIKKLELEFLCAINWNIYISNEEFFNKLECVERTLAKREGLRRGWLTYTELLNFLPTFTLAKFLINNITIMIVSYAASVITIAGAFYLVSSIPGNGILKTNREKITEMNLVNVNTESEITNFTSKFETNMNIETELKLSENVYKHDDHNTIEQIYTEKLLNDDLNENCHISEEKTLKIENNEYNKIHDLINSISNNNIYPLNLQNLTETMFWNELGNVAQNSFDRIPFVWFKFL